MLLCKSCEMGSCCTIAAFSSYITTMLHCRIAALMPNTWLSTAKPAAVAVSGFLAVPKHASCGRPRLFGCRETRNFCPLFVIAGNFIEGEIAEPITKAKPSFSAERMAMNALFQGTAIKEGLFIS